MSTIFICYESNSRTGLSEVKGVTDRGAEASIFLIQETKNARRVEEWDLDDGLGTIVFRNDNSEEKL